MAKKRRQPKVSPLEKNFLSLAMKHFPIGYDEGNLFYFQMEHHFLPGCKYRMDFAWPHLKVAIETQGFKYHSSITALIRDYTKYNLAQEHGWVVFQINSAMIKESFPTFCKQVKLTLGKRVNLYMKGSMP